MYDWIREDYEFRKYYVHFEAGMIMMRVPFWTPMEIIIRDAKEGMIYPADVLYIEDESGYVHWRREDA